MPVVIRKDTAGTTQATDGEYASLQVDANGYLRVTSLSTATIGKLGANSGTDIGDVDVTSLGAVSGTPVNYRTGVTAADVLAATGTVTCTKINSVGALTAGTYYVKVVALNAHGRGVGKAGDTTVTTETTNLCIKAAFAAVTGATHYDIYCTTAADPLWVGRITEAQRASGIIIDAVGSTAAGGAVDSVYIYAIGTGLARGTTAAVSTAYVMPATPVVCTGKQYVDFEIKFSRTGDAVAPALIVAPFLANSRLTQYAQGTIYTLSFGGTSGLYGSMIQRIRVQVQGEEAVHLCVLSIAGTGANVEIDYILS